MTVGVKKGKKRVSAAGSEDASDIDAGRLANNVLGDEYWLQLSQYDPGLQQQPWEARRAAGKELRRRLPREVHGEWSPHAGRPDPLEIVLATNEGRQQELIPLRMARMAASPFTFFRGAAAVMASDLAQTPITGLPVVMDGDAHLNNFGLYATPQREVVFDINDFDEVVVGPWEWDLKRLAASVNIAGREHGLNPRERRFAVEAAVRGYCVNADRFQRSGVLEIWYRHFYPEPAMAAARHALVKKIDAKTREVWGKAIEKAKRTTSETLLPKVAERGAGGAWHFKLDPPVLTEVDSVTTTNVVNSLVEYSESLTRERRFMFKRYHPVDVAHRVVGVGSVGVRAYLVLLFGNGESDPLFLQVKEATEPAHLKYARPVGEEHHGWRVVTGQRVLQASTDFMLGWTTIDGRDFYVRQMKNMKGSIPIEMLSRKSFALYGFACGATLARGHARTGDIAKIAGYCGRSAALGSALADFAEAYADQNARDHAALVDAISEGRIQASNDD
ncbi:MAG TPA: DUF2252 domain-containing protein [Blastocatellia bacterium]|nr:DUF2252 domain-containing protein [Blastocatellia bacterium]